MKTIRIIIADDHPVVRDGLAGILNTQPDFEVVGEAEDGQELLNLCNELTPDVVLTDIEMPQMDGVEALREIQRNHPQMHVIVFTAFDSDDRIIGAVQAGARGYLLKGAPRDEVFRAVRTVYAGGSLLEPSITSKLLSHINNSEKKTLDSGDTLTEREMEVLQLLGKGMTNKEIGAELYITERTVKFYVSAILSKLNASNRTEAVTIAAAKRLINLS